MGLGRQIKGLTKEYLKDPKGQYFRHLKKLLDISKTHKIPKKEVVRFVRDWEFET